MHNNTTMIMLMVTMSIGSMLSICSNSWLGVWMGLEVNLLAFMPLLSNNNEMMMNETWMKYFLIQTLGSTAILFSVTSFNKTLNGYEETLFNVLIYSSLILKLGDSPFHMWFVEVMGATVWINCMILMTWQKVAPMCILPYCKLIEKLLMVIVIGSIIIGTIGGLNQTSTRQMLAFSSISHMGWMMMTVIVNETMWETYFLAYSVVSLTAATMMNKNYLFSYNQMFNSNTKNKMNKMIIILSILSLGGLPPFTGFFPKWMVIQLMIENNMTAMMTAMAMMTSVNLYFYIRIGFSSLMLTSTEIKWNPIQEEAKKSDWLSTLCLMSTVGMITVTSITNLM
uniref:NADH-ubiquinone oxidoreductase chain 2 n=1 Tax=Proscopia sp. HS-2014 TaxID=1564209 RepID=A0A0N7AY94_9ORTH|nr:NADH dehydrogenase subunit 2 [Proscopia sp. HS-2014]